MMQRRRQAMCTIDPRFEDFDSFMKFLGRKDHPSCSLDRIDHTKNHYAPGEVQWATKAQQNKNRKNTVWMTYAGTRYPEHLEKTLPLVEWAKLTRQHPGTMRRRRTDGWDDTENIEGTRNRLSKPFAEMSFDQLVGYLPWDEDKARAQEEGFLQYRRDGEDRFAFKRRVILGELVPKKIMRRFPEVALNALEDDDYLRIELIPESKRIVEGKWVKRPSASMSSWKKFIGAIRDLDRRKSEHAQKYAEWKAAIDARRQSTLNGKALAKMNAKLRAEILGNGDADQDDDVVLPTTI